MSLELAASFCALALRVVLLAERRSACVTLGVPTGCDSRDGSLGLELLALLELSLELGLDLSADVSREEEVAGRSALGLVRLVGLGRLLSLGRLGRLGRLGSLGCLLLLDLGGRRA